MVVEARRVCTLSHCNVFCKYERLSVDSFFDMFSIFEVHHAVVIEFVQIKLLYSSMHKSRDVKKHAQLVTVVVI